MADECACPYSTKVPNKLYKKHDFIKISNNTNDGGVMPANICSRPGTEKENKHRKRRGEEAAAEGTEEADRTKEEEADRTEAEEADRTEEETAAARIVIIIVNSVI